MAEEPDPRLALIYAESVRALEAQESHISDLRGRAISLMGIIAGASGLIAAVSTKKHGIDVPEVVAVIAFLAALGLTVAATWQVWFRFSHDPAQLLDAYVDGEYPRSIDDAYRWLAKRNGEYWTLNEELAQSGFRRFRERIPDTDHRWRLGPMFCLRLAAVALAVEVAAWVVHVQR